MKEYLDKTTSLTPEVRKIICDKATEYPHTGVYNMLNQQGTYLCRRCGLALFRGLSQFQSSCGWPAFDEAIAGAVKEEKDRDGMRTEIVCGRCTAHLGHVFNGEFYTKKNTRHCVNSASLDFVEDTQVVDSEEAILAGGCFWGVEHYLRQIPGVLKVESGYTGGHLLNPTYRQICTGSTGHYEAVRVIFDCSKTNYHQIIKNFFQIHDPTQPNGQGPDLGPQYQSAIFYFTQKQYQEAEHLMQLLKTRGYQVVTQLIKAQPFWTAEDYHQNYYRNNNKIPYCHRYTNRFAAE